MNGPNSEHDDFHWKAVSSSNRGGHIETFRLVLSFSILQRKEAYCHGRERDAVHRDAVHPPALQQWRLEHI